MTQSPWATRDGPVAVSAALAVTLSSAAPQEATASVKVLATSQWCERSEPMIPPKGGWFAGQDDQTRESSLGFRFFRVVWQDDGISSRVSAAA
jgi:hypothetical protein